MTAASSLQNLPKITTSVCLRTSSSKSTFLFKPHLLQISNQYSIHDSNNFPRFSRSIRIEAVTAMATESAEPSSKELMKPLFVEMAVDLKMEWQLCTDRQDITAAAMRACRDAISSNSIPAFRRGSIPGVTFEQMKLQIKLGVPRPLQQSLDIEKVKSVFPYGKILDVEVVDGGLICSSGVHVEEMGDKNDDCYIVNAAVYVGY
ncbi:hypothetical protein Cgig2_008763 [Carnegiea gigantea]|uniref:Uncharacterized protein n=1 Tax=Carnegiea gigantea TaxID=171969 RepID=A0A9Q1K6Q1_9CARY|nr:hypothetical protein Cgig2_008763 [Carnegiea gigantea]